MCSVESKSHVDQSRRCHFYIWTGNHVGKDCLPVPLHRRVPVQAEGNGRTGGHVRDPMADRTVPPAVFLPDCTPARRGRVGEDREAEPTGWQSASASAARLPQRQAYLTRRHSAKHNLEALG